MEHQNNFVMIPMEVLPLKSITPLAKLLLGLVLSGASQKGYAWASNKFYGAALGVTADTVSRTLKQLEKANLLELKITKNEQGTFRKIYPLGARQKPLGGAAKMPSGVGENAEGGAAKMPSGGTQECLPKRIDKKVIDKVIDNNKKEAAQEGPSSLPYYEATNRIAAAFTKHTGQQFRIPKKLGAFRRYGLYKSVKARLEDGANLEQLLGVIEMKAKHWKGTEWERHLVYTTLFRKSSFEDKYLPQLQIEQNKQTKTNNDGKANQESSGLAQKLAARAAKRLQNLGH